MNKSLLYLTDVQNKDPCNPSPCGFNAQCRDGVCTCLQNYKGDPYYGCRPECVTNMECPMNNACVRNRCVNPCPAACAPTAQCNVYNHIPMCTCNEGTTGDAFIGCHEIQGK